MLCGKLTESQNALPLPRGVKIGHNPLMADKTEILGIDIGGSGIKGATVNLETGELTQERYRIETPQPSKPEAVAEVVVDIVKNFKWEGPIGCTFPAIVKNGVTLSAANVDDDWIGADAAALFNEATGCPVSLLNDADAAGVAEMTFGAGKDKQGVVFLLTFGTGIGSAMFIDGKLIPNTELGHMALAEHEDAEKWAASSVRKAEDLSWKHWGKRVNVYLGKLEALFSPDLFIIGGGVSKKSEKFFEYLELDTPFVAAELRNEAGIVGAALVASREQK